MSEQTLRVPGLSDDENVTLNLLADQLKKKSRRNLLRSAYYDGRRAVRQVGTVIPPQYASLALALGWAAKGVDGLGRRCHLEGFVWSDGDLGSLGIQELEDSNFLRSEISQARTDALIHGVSYLINTRGDESAGEPASLIHSKDALNATGVWNDRRRALDNLLSVTSREDDQITGFVLYLDGETVNADRVDGRWEVSRSTHPWGVPVDPIVYRPRTSRRMGRSRISRPVMSLQDAALRALVRLEAHMDIYAIPKLMLLGADESIFKNADGSMKASWQIALGRAFGIPDNEDSTYPQNARADVKQFSAESPEPHLAQLNALAKLMARETDLSDADFALTDMANPTAADSYSEARDNLISEAEEFMDDMNVPVRRVVARGLAIQNGLGSVPAGLGGLQPEWRDPRHTSRTAAADAGSKQLAMVPWLAETEVGLELLGLSKPQIERALAQRRRAAGRQIVAALAARSEAPVEAVAGDDGS